MVPLVKIFSAAKLGGSSEEQAGRSTIRPANDILVNFPDALTANQVNIGKLGSTPSADTSGQGVLEWDGSRVGPNPDTKASEVINRQGVKWVVGIGLAVLGGKLFLDSRKSE